VGHRRTCVKAATGPRLGCLPAASGKAWVRRPVRQVLCLPAFGDGGMGVAVA